MSEIRPDQRALLDSFKIERLNDRDEILRIVEAFSNPDNENLVEYLKGDSFKDDECGREACYVISDKEDKLLCYFSLKSGILYSEYEELELLQKHHIKKLQLNELQEKIRDNEELNAIVQERRKELKNLSERLQRAIGGNYDPTKHKQVSTSYPGIELSHFCINSDYRDKWESYNLGEMNKLGVVMFWHFIVEKLKEIQKLIGSEYFYLFAADMTADRHLVNHYKNRMELRDDLNVLTLMPIYDLNCEFLCNRIKDLITSQEFFFAHFNDTDEI